MNDRATPTVVWLSASELTVASLICRRCALSRSLIPLIPLTMPPCAFALVLGL